MARYSDQIDSLIERLEGELEDLIDHNSSTGGGSTWAVKFGTEITAISDGIDRLKRLKAEVNKGGEREPMPVLV